MAKVSVVKNGIGYSPLTEKVYMGRQNTAKRMWIGNKTDITQDFLAVSFAYFEENTIREISTGKKKNLFLNISNDKASLENAIKNLTTRLSKLKK